MDLITYALTRQAAANGAGGSKISNMEIVNGNLIVNMSDGTNINAGKVPTTDTTLIAKLDNMDKDVNVLKETAITSVSINGIPMSNTGNTINLPLASNQGAGLVKGTLINSENSINKISINDDGTMEVISLSSDKLIPGDETLVFNCGTTL